MPRVKLDRLVTNNPVKRSTPIEEQAIGTDLAPAIVPNPVTLNLKKLAGTNFLVDVETGIVYLDPVILKALKNN